MRIQITNEEVRTALEQLAEFYTKELTREEYDSDSKIEMFGNCIACCPLCKVLNSDCKHCPWMIYMDTEAVSPCGTWLNSVCAGSWHKDLNVVRTRLDMITEWLTIGISPRKN